MDEINVDDENACVYTEKIDGYEAFIVEKEGSCYLIWNNDERYFVLSSDIPHEELIEIARSVRKINR